MRSGALPLAIVLTGCASGPALDSAKPVLQLRTNWQPVMRYLDSAVARGAAPGAVLGVTHDGRRFVYGTGQLGDADPTRPGASTIYDLASLTKVVGLTTAMMLAVDEGRVELDAPVQRYVPAFAGERKDLVTLRLLLAHAAGLQAWRPLFRDVVTRQEAFTLVDTIPLESLPGAQERYSDLGVILLTQVLETAYQERIDSLLERRIFRPLGLLSLRYVPPSSWVSRIAPTELDPWRGRILRGEVHDENAAVMDGVSGHAGLFGSAEDLLTFAEWMLQQWNGDEAVRRHDGTTFRRSVVHEFTRIQEVVPGSSRALGWDAPTTGSSAGTLLSRRSIGHTGFTGTSLWIDPEHRLAIVLLSNRVHPTRNNPRWNPVRAAVADLVMTTLYQDLR